MRRIYLLVAVIATVLCFLVLFGSDASSTAATILSGFSPGLLLIYAALSLLSLGVRAIRYQLILRSVAIDCETPARGDLLLLTAIRNMFVDLLPARLGELSFFPVINRLGVSPQRAISTFGVSFFLDIVVLLLLLVGFFWMQHEQRAWFVLVVVLLLVAGAIFLVLYGLPNASRWLRSIEQRERDLPRLANFCRWCREAGERVSADLLRLWASRHLGAALFYTVVLRAVKYYSLYLLYVGAVEGVLGQKVTLPILTVMAAYVLAEGAASLPVSGVMGFGSYEAVMSAVLIGAGVPLDGSTVYGVSFSIHVITQLVGYSIGAVALAIFALRRGR